MKKINQASLVPMDLFLTGFPLRIDIVYAQGGHPENIFGALYRPQARLWLHEDLAAVVLRAAKLCHARHGHVFVLKDGLRTVEAQEKMQETDIVKANPHWCEEPDRLLSTPGTGAHPRAMAIDITLEGRDMGTCFDYLTEDPAHNPAARDYTDLPEEALENRRRLSGAMVQAAKDLNVPLVPLADEWWDFRYPKEIYQQYAPLSDYGLPPEMRMTEDAASEAEWPPLNLVALREKIIRRAQAGSAAR